MAALVVAVAAIVYVVYYDITQTRRWDEWVDHQGARIDALDALLQELTPVVRYDTKPREDVMLQETVKRELGGRTFTFRA